MRLKGVRFGKRVQVFFRQGDWLAPKRREPVSSGYCRQSVGLWRKKKKKMKMAGRKET